MEVGRIFAFEVRVIGFGPQFLRSLLEKDWWVGFSEERECEESDCAGLLVSMW